ncbi:MAG TPA: T9SS type A sorting domain-containing protein [Ignavibacteria bacterium]|nr:T9SS type A sorting domain-containing protein [Ignavibacteria bacterium]
MRGKSITIFLALLALFSLRTFSQNYTWEALYGSNNNEGVNGNVYAITTFQGKIVVAGGFTQAGGVPVRNVAMWDRATSTWSPMGTNLGINAGDTVRALEVYNNELYAGGFFSAGSGVSNIARWNGSTWVLAGSSADGEVSALKVFGAALVAGGEFNNIGKCISSYNGSTWTQIGDGFEGSGSHVFALTIYNSNLVAAGRFENSGSTPLHNIAYWNGSTWIDLSISTDERIHAVAVHNGQLFAGGRFTNIGGVSAQYIARYNSGTSWSALAVDSLDGRVFAIASYSPTELIVGGQFKNAGNLYVNYIAKWNGTSWSRMITGMDEKVEALYKNDSTMYAGGEFTIAGGKIAHHIARWYNHPTDSILGTVKYADNNANVIAGSAYAIRRDYFTNEVIVVDSGRINGGLYSIPRPSTTDTLRIIWLADDELDFVPTYYPSTIDWRSAVTVVPGQNTNNINGLVYRVTPEPLSGSPAATVHGTIHLNIVIPLDPPGSYPYRSKSVLYVKQSNTYKKFSVSATNENYVTTPLQAGTYELIAYRLGYCFSSKTVTINPNTTDTIVNFTLDTCGPNGIQSIGGKIPNEFTLKQNYPNPFNPATTISFDLPVNGFVQMKVYDILGREVALLVNEFLTKGMYKYVFDAVELPSGVYFYKLTAVDPSASLMVSETRKMVLIK